MAGATHPSHTGAHNASQFVLCRAFDRSRAFWPNETDDELSERLWLQARLSWSQRRYVRRNHSRDESSSDVVERTETNAVRVDATTTVPTLVFSVERHDDLGQRRRRTERALSALLVGMRNGASRWRPSRHIATSLVCRPPHDVEDCNNVDDNEHDDQRHRVESRPSARCTITDDGQSLWRYHEAKLLYTLYEWFVDDGSRRAVVVDGATATSVEELHTRRRLLDSLCLDIITYTVSPGCNRDIAEAANRNARARDEFAKVTANLRLDANTPAISDADLDAVLSDGNGQIVEQRIVSTVSQSLTDERYASGVAADTRDQDAVHRRAAVSNGAEVHSSRGESDRTLASTATSSNVMTVRRNDEDSRARRNSISTEAAVAAIAWKLADPTAQNDRVLGRNVKMRARPANDGHEDEEDIASTMEPSTDTPGMSDWSSRDGGGSITANRGTTLEPIAAQHGTVTLRRGDDDAENVRRSTDRSIEVRRREEAHDANVALSDRREEGTRSVQRTHSLLDGSDRFRREREHERNDRRAREERFDVTSRVLVDRRLAGEHDRVLTDTTTRRERWSAYDDVWRDVDRDLEEHLARASRTVGTSVGAKRSSLQRLNDTKRAKSRLTDEHTNARGHEASRTERAQRALRSVSQSS